MANEAVIGWMQQQLARYIYKPGYEMSIDSRGDDYSGVMLGGDAIFRMSFRAPDSRNPEQVIPLIFSVVCESQSFSDRNEKWFAWNLRDWLMQHERHEMREWLRQDGELYNDPHKVM